MMIKSNISVNTLEKGKEEIDMNIAFITPASALRRMKLYRIGGKLYGHSNAITGPLILGGILKCAGHHVEVYEELNGNVPLEKLMENTDIFCFYTMTSTAPRVLELAQTVRAHADARIIIGGIHASAVRRNLSAMRIM
ncbi:MAG: hypothetical protein V8R80_09360 [Eubacterium sp.]